MANNYSQFSEMIPCESKEQQDWLMQELAVGIKDDDGEGYPVCEFETDGKDVWVYSPEFADLDALAEVVVAFQLQFGITKPWTLTWADSCSKPRLGNFGGGGMVVYRGEFWCMSVWDWCVAEAQRLQA